MYLNKLFLHFKRLCFPTLAIALFLFGLVFSAKVGQIYAGSCAYASRTGLSYVACAVGFATGCSPIAAVCAGGANCLACNSNYSPDNPVPGQVSCGAVGGTCTRLGHACGGIEDDTLYCSGGDAFFCCRPVYCEDVPNSSCMSYNVWTRSGCPSGTTDQNNYACSSDTDVCCTPPNSSAQYPPTPNCNSGLTPTGSCHGAAYNTCSTNNGVQSYEYTTYTGGGNCNVVSAPNQACTQTNCDGNNGYSCNAGICNRTVSGKITDSSTGAGIANVAVGASGTAGSGLDYTDSSGNWSIGGMGYLRSFTVSPNNSSSAYGGVPCINGYLCNGGSPNPTSRSGTIGGSGDCGSSCNFTFTPGEISGHVYIDYNHNSAKDGADIGIAGVTVSAGGKSDATDANGLFDIKYLNSGTYTVTVTVPAGYTGVVSSRSVTIGPNNLAVALYITPLYQISGSVFNDDNLNQEYDSGSETLYTGGSTISIAGNVNKTVNASGGSYDGGQVFTSGTYIVSYNTSSSPLPTAYRFTTPQSWSVTVGKAGTSPACSVGSSPDGSCGGANSGSISSLNFGITNENSWDQSACMDMRNDNQFTDVIPSAPSCGGVTSPYAAITQNTCSTGTGIVYSCDNTPDFGLGSANVDNWQVGGSGASQECFTGPGLDVIRTSYDYLQTTARQSNITPTDMTTVCGANGTANCTLDSNLTKGVYQSTGDVYLNAYTFSAPADPASESDAYIFLIHGNLHILGNISIPKGSVAIFSASGNIYVDKSVGQDLSNPSDPSVNSPDLEGIYSADQNFIIESYASGTNVCNNNGTSIDKKLNIVGAVITNAGKAGGGITNNRDLCKTDLVCPSFSVGDGINSGDQGLIESYLLSLIADGKFVTRKLFNWQEIKP